MATGAERSGGDSIVGSRGPAFLHTALMVLVLLIVAVVTFAPPPSSPPAIAEVAPQALEQITEAPVEQAVSSGGQEGGVPAAAPSPSPTPTIAPPETVEEEPAPPTPYRCVGDPPRQIEDPQSPPCLPPFDGDNGGATYQGVTRDTITVVVPDLPEGYPPLKALEGFFNRRFQLWGRKLVLKGIVAEQDPSQDEASSQQHLARVADEEYEAFASLHLDADSGTTYYRELARRGMVAVSYGPVYTQEILASLAPYVWQYAMSLDRVMTVTGDWMCSRLAGQTADYAGDPDLVGQRRRFGLVYENNSGNRYEPTPLIEALEACGEEFAVVRHMESFRERAVTDAPAYTQSPEVVSTVAALKSNDVTSVLCLCATNMLGPIARQSSQQDYVPEWLVASYKNHEYTTAQHLNNGNASQRRGMFGISALPRLLPAERDPSIWAIQEEDPNAFVANRDDSSAIRQGNIHRHYRTLLLLASGIQMAGPELTPEALATGLHDTTFPNPPSPLEPGRVGFPAGSFSMTRDVAEFWWSNSSQPPFRNEPPGTWCYIDGGARRSVGEWPGQPQWFAGGCDSGAEG